jgi:hypothetical protein
VKKVRKLSKKDLREHLSENSRQSMAAEGKWYSKEDWDRVRKKVWKYIKNSLTEE